MTNLSIRNLAMKSAAFLLFATASSFSGNWGGDHYRIYVNNKMVMEEFVHGQKGVKAFTLDSRSENDQVTVYYSHCGKVGNGRHLSIRDGRQVLKEWKFADVKDNVKGIESPMSWKSKDVLTLQKNGIKKLQLFYTSKEMPEGKLLAVVNLGKDNETKP